MRKLGIVTILGAMALLLGACAPSERSEGENAAAGGQSQSYPQRELPIEEDEEEAVDMFAAPVCVKEVPPDAICTMDINACGHASICNCGDGYVYDAALGKCMLDIEGVGEATFVEVADDECVRPATDACTRDINACGQPSRCSCDEGFAWNSVVGMCLRIMTPAEE